MECYMSAWENKSSITLQVSAPGIAGQALLEHTVIVRRHQNTSEMFESNPQPYDEPHFLPGNALFGSGTQPEHLNVSLISGYLVESNCSVSSKVKAVQRKLLSTTAMSGCSSCNFSHCWNSPGSLLAWLRTANNWCGIERKVMFTYQKGSWSGVGEKKKRRNWGKEGNVNKHSLYTQ